MAYGQQYYGSRFEPGFFCAMCYFTSPPTIEQFKWPPEPHQRNPWLGPLICPPPTPTRRAAESRMGGTLATRRSERGGEVGSSKGRRQPGTRREGRILCASSLGCAPGAILAWVLGLRGFAAVSVLQLGLSVNYWRRPEWGLRRNLDIGCALLLALAVFSHWSSEAQCAYSSAARLGYTACFLTWSRATSAWAAERPSWVWWHACFHALIGSVNLVLAWGCGLRLRGVARVQ